MTRKISRLTQEVADKANKAIKICNSEGVDILVYCTLRTLQEQAILWRKSRTTSEINAKIEKFNNRGFKFLGDIIRDVGPQNGELWKHITMAAPGESWHNYREAFDAVPIISGRLAWRPRLFPKEWRIYGNAIKKAGLQWSGDWVKFCEYAHAQLKQGSNPLKSYSPDRIYDMLFNYDLLR